MRPIVGAPPISHCGHLLTLGKLVISWAPSLVMSFIHSPTSTACQAHKSPTHCFALVSTPWVQGGSIHPGLWSIFICDMGGANSIGWLFVSSCIDWLLAIIFLLSQSPPLEWDHHIVALLFFSFDFRPSLFFVVLHCCLHCGSILSCLVHLVALFMCITFVFTALSCWACPLHSLFFFSIAQPQHSVLVLQGHSLFFFGVGITLFAPKQLLLLGWLT